MNIFYLDKDTAICARYHNNKHTVKMILEYSQLLSTAHRVLDGIQETEFRPVKNKEGKFRRVKVWKLNESMENLYSATHRNHPSAKWIRDSSENYYWLFLLLCNLHLEYSFRYSNKIHKSSRLLPNLSNLPKNIPIGKFTEPTPAMPDKYKIGDAIESYRNYYRLGKNHLASWKDRPIPYWY